MSDTLQFPTREEFRNWLSENCLSTDGVWLLFGKTGSPKTLEAGEALEEALSEYYALIRSRGISPQVKMPEYRVVKRLDRKAVSRIFGNIISNAIKYSDGDFSVTLTGEGEITFSNHASCLDEVQVGRLFDRFYTVEDASHSTGLGLSIAKTLAEQMGGSIGAEYRGGEVRFRVWLTK